MAEKSGKPSSSAVGVAALRAAARERDQAVRNPDYLAINLLPFGLRTLVKIRPAAWLVLKQYQRVLPGGYYFHTVRTKHIDAVLQQCAQDGISQLVILGAGFDTRAYRFRDMLAKTRVFELDQPDTQAVKKEKVSKLKGSLPDNVTYLPIDFNVQTLDILLDSGDLFYVPFYGHAVAFVIQFLTSQRQPREELQCQMDALQGLVDNGVIKNTTLVLPGHGPAFYLREKPETLKQTSSVLHFCQRF